MKLCVYKEEVTPLAVNAYIAYDAETGDGLLIDPGEFTESMGRYVEKNRIRIHYILDTHGHFDHIGGNAAARRLWEAPIVCHPLDAPMLESAELSGSDFFGMPIELSKAEQTIVDGQRLQAGSLELEILHTPGHTPGGVCVKIGDDVFTGDTLFAGGVGRYDFPGGNRAALFQSIREKLMILPEATRIYPGHGPESQIGVEARTNPFL